MSTPLFFERQRLLFCAKHTLNNLLQREEVTKPDLDRIAEELVANNAEASTSSWFNPHRSVLGLGNFDVNVITIALERAKLFTTWLDARSDLRLLKLDTVFGIIVNEATFWGRHWFAIRQIEGVWYNLDSKLAEPKPFAGTGEVVGLIELKRRQQSAQVLVVTDHEIVSQSTELFASPS